MNRRICSYLIYYFFYLCFFLFVLGWKWRRHFEQNEDLIGKYVGTSFKILTTGQTFTETIFTRFENTVSWKFERLILSLQCGSNTMASCCFTRDYSWILTLKIYRKYLWPYKLVWSVGIIWNTMQNIV